jgi:hypothetical protein
MKPMLGLLLMFAFLVFPQGEQKFSGTITDDMCPTADHSKMRMGANDAECAIACAHSHAASFVLFDGKQAFQLSDQESTEKLAGKKVTVTGTLDSKTMKIQVRSIVTSN